ncbi:MAG: DUF2291 family protein [Pedosphaera sp.]|nr:DUF2291 family protein [Pedosphaera sp.]
MPSRTPLFVVAALAVAALVSWRFPLFHIVPLKQAQQEQKAGVFDSVKAATEFWEAKLLPGTERAVEVKELLAALAKDPAAARKQHGRTLGIGGATMFLVRGSGKVAEVGDDAIVVALDGKDAKVSLSVGLLFGNTVRDASGLLDVSAYPDSQEFNALSTQLNALVETKVSPALKQAAALGKTIRFAGCFELEEDARPEALTLIPIKVEWP